MNPKDALKRVWYKVFRDHPYGYMGRLVIPFCSRAYLRRVQDDFLIHPQPRSLVRRILEAGLSSRYFAQDEAAIASANRSTFWGGVAGRRWHQMKAQTLRDPRTLHLEFEEFRAPIVEHLRALVRDNAEYTTLCEIGTGNGLFLKYLSQSPDLQSLRFVGIDLNADQIAENRKALATDRLDFECAEVVAWIETRCQEGTIFLTHDTLHNFTPTEMRQLFEAIARFKTVAIVLSEPIDPRLPVVALSKPRGGIGISFSHNYVAYLSHCGYTILSHEVFENRNLPVYDHRLVVARPGASRHVAMSAPVTSRSSDAGGSKARGFPPPIA